MTHSVRESIPEEDNVMAEEKTGGRVPVVLKDVAELPERVATRGLRLLKSRARSRDMVGEAAYRTLEVVHGGFGAVAKSFSRLEHVSEPPARAGHAPAARPSGRVEKAHLPAEATR
jgi:hypothetical protein